MIWVLNVAADAPDIDTLKPADERREHADLRRRRHQPRLRPVRHPPRPRSPSTRSPKRLQKATIAIEDEHFYEHGGVDYSAIVRAAVENVEAGEVKQGASTITQQLVRNLYIDDPEGHDRAQDQRGEDGDAVRGRVHEEPDPQPVPEHRLLRDQRRQDRGRGRGRRRRSTSTRTSPTSTSARRRCSPACPQAPTDYNPFLNPKGAKQRRNEVLDGDARPGLHHPGDGYDKITSRGPRARPRLQLRDSARSRTSSTSSSRS